MRRRPSSAASSLAVLALLAGPACRPAGAPAAATSRTTTEPDFDAGIEAAYLTQGVQDRAGAVPLLAGRPGLLRVFLRAIAPGVPAPAVRARLVETASGATLRSWTPTSPLAELPTGLFEAARGASWNVEVAGEDVQPGRHLELEMDLVPGVEPSLQSPTLRLPASGSLDVRAGAPLRVTLVPIVQSGLVPDVDAGRTAESWLELAAAVYPVVGVEVAVAAPFQTEIRLSPGGVGWSELLGDLERKRVAEGSGRHYLGVVRLATASGTVGRGLNDGRSVLVADLPAHYQRIAAHELGHNLGLRHAPCGTDDEGSLDPDWPLDRDYADARIGVFGWDPRSGAVKDPAVTYDLMSYCGGPDTTWISDYGFVKALPAAVAARVDVAFAGGAAGGAEVAAARQPCLLVSGRLEGGEAGALALDPAHAVETVPALLPAGDHEVEILDRAGRVLAAVAFEPVQAPAEEPGAPASWHFAMAVPLSAEALAEADRVVVRRRGVEVARRQAGAAASAEVLVRDPRTGEVLAFARAGSAARAGGSR